MCPTSPRYVNSYKNGANYSDSMPQRKKNSLESYLLPICSWKAACSIMPKRTTPSSTSKRPCRLFSHKMEYVTIQADESQLSQNFAQITQHFQQWQQDRI